MLVVNVILLGQMCQKGANWFLLLVSNLYQSKLYFLQDSPAFDQFEIKRIYFNLFPPRSVELGTEFSHSCFHNGAYIKEKPAIKTRFCPEKSPFI